jgi:hypothetical protein
MTSKFEITGKVKEVFEPQTFASGFTKREFVVTTNEDFPQDVKFTCIKDKCRLLDSIYAGFNVTVKFNIKGNEFKGKYYVDLQAWQIATEEEQVNDFHSQEPDDRFGGDGDGDPMPF